jgi:hypothetical protein
VPFSFCVGRRPAGGTLVIAEPGKAAARELIIARLLADENDWAE